MVHVVNKRGTLNYLCYAACTRTMAQSLPDATAAVTLLRKPACWHPLMCCYACPALGLCAFPPRHAPHTLPVPLLFKPPS